MATALYAGTAAASLLAPRVADRVARRVPRTAADLFVAGAFATAGFGIVTIAERARPFRDEWNEPDRSEITDAVHLTIGGGFALLAGSILTAPLTSRLMRLSHKRAFEQLPLPARIAVATLVSDLYHTTLHRAVHRYEPLWRIHSVHHSAPRLYSGTAGRFHPLQGVLVVIGDEVILAALGLDPRAGLSHRVLRTLFGQLQHSNIALDSGVLNYILSTPERHRWHHSALTREGNTNFGDVVCLWDKLFGTGFLPDDYHMYGDIGLVGAPNYPRDVMGQWVVPFRWDTVVASGADRAHHRIDD